MTIRLIALPLVLCVLVFGPANAEANSRVSGDFNGDGHDDLAVAASHDAVGSVSEAGAVNVIYGSAGRLTSTDNQFWHQDSAGIVGVAEDLDFFGSRLAAGDFNGDGFDDLAVGVLAEDVGSVAAGGAVNVIYGSAAGLTAEGNQLWHQDSTGIVGAAEESDTFGSSLTTGDFNGNGFDDLAVGVRNESVGSVSQAGAVNVIYGSRVGLRADGNQLWHQDSSGIEDAAEEFDGFGYSLTAGDFNGNGFDDLAIGGWGEDVGSVVDAGAVNVIYGAASRLTADGDQFWHQESTGIADAAETDNRFGFSLAAGDFNGGGHDDLAVGVAGEDVGSVSQAGAVNVIYGAGVGLRATGNQFWHQDSSGIADAAETDDFFGISLTAGDFNGNGFDDLAVGVPDEDVGALEDAGAVNVIYGSANRLSATGEQFWHQDSSGIADPAEDFDRFGDSLTAGDLNGSGHDDLAVGVRNEAVGSVEGAGAANVIYGAGVGLRATGNQFWHQDSTGIVGVAEVGDRFGSALPT